MTCMEHRKTGLFYRWVVVFLFFFSGCTVPYVATERADIPIEIKSLLILPFRDMSGIYGPGEQVRCSLCGKVFTTGVVQQQAAEYLTETLVSLLQERGGYSIMPPHGGEGTFSPALAEGKEDDSELQIVREAGMAAEADAVLVGRLYRFKERAGNSYAVESPASVAFELDLIRTSDGRLLWSGSYDETQQPLFDNLFRMGAFIQRGMKWVTARQLAASGLKILMQRFP